MIFISFHYSARPVFGLILDNHYHSGKEFTTQAQIVILGYSVSCQSPPGGLAYFSGRFQLRCADGSILCRVLARAK